MINPKDTVVLFIDFQEKLMPSIWEREEIERKVCSLARGTRILELAVLVTRQYPKGLGDTITELRDALGHHDCTDKTAFSCLGEPEFVKKLELAGKKNVLIAGVETHICVQQTVLDLLARGMNVYLAADCCGSRRERDQLLAEKRMAGAGAVVTTMESVLFEMMGDANHPSRKAVSALIK